MTITDSGVGMDESVVAQAFVPFFSDRRAQGAAGLGLSVSLGLVESHHGTIRLHSLPGARHHRRDLAADRAARWTPRRDQPTAVAPGRLPRVLCVDDEPVTLRLVTQTPRADGAPGHDRPESGRRPRACSTSVGSISSSPTSGCRAWTAMPSSTSIRERDPQVPVIVATGYASLDNAIRALRDGASGMLIKPFTGEEFTAEVTNALQRARIRHDALQYRLRHADPRRRRPRADRGDRGARPRDRRPLHRSSERWASGRPADGPIRAGADDDPDRRLPARHRQDRDCRPDPPQARPADRRGIPRDAAPLPRSAGRSSRRTRR